MDGDFPWGQVAGRIHNGTIYSIRIERDYAEMPSGRRNGAGSTVKWPY